mmetsp:Transcript_22957/g.64159  ORF Transcript_22957/g.64159 Transcript_22957/m.64159 type:complete len:269 (+) Transcript_22957:503-1309(+)
MVRPPVGTPRCLDAALCRIIVRGSKKEGAAWLLRVVSDLCLDIDELGEVLGELWHQGGCSVRLRRALACPLLAGVGRGARRGGQEGGVRRSTPRVAYNRALGDGKLLARGLLPRPARRRVPSDADCAAVSARGARGALRRRQEHLARRVVALVACCWWIFGPRRLALLAGAALALANGSALHPAAAAVARRQRGSQLGPRREVFLRGALGSVAHGGLGAPRPGLAGEAGDAAPGLGGPGCAAFRRAAPALGIGPVAAPEAICSIGVAG